MRTPDFEVHTLIEALQGTATSIDQHLPEGMNWEDLTKEDHDAIDADIFECEECGWWCERSEESSEEEQTCTDCRPENEKE